MSDLGNYIWLIIAIALVIAEVLTGTFYLLVLGFSAFIACIAQWFGFEFLGQTIAFLMTAIAIIIPLYVHRKKLKLQEKTFDLDAGETVVIEQWENGVGQTRYRGTTWQATLLEQGQENTSSSNLYVIVRIDGSRLLVKPKE